MADKKQRTELYVLGGLLVVAALVWYYQSAKTTATASRFSALTGTYTPINVLGFEDDGDPLNSPQTTEYKPSGRDIFAAPRVTHANSRFRRDERRNDRVVIYDQPQPESRPKLTMRFFGYGSLPAGSPRRAFLLDGAEVRIVHEGETVSSHIRILHISNDSIEYEDTSTHLHNANPIELDAVPAG